jgi:hypothetical protein
MNASKEFRQLQAVRLKKSIQEARKSWHEVKASLARYHAKEHKFDFFANAFLRAQPEFTKLWFDLLEWVLIMGGLEYLHSKTKSTVVVVVLYISLAIFALYVPFAIGRFFQFFRFPFIKSIPLTFVLSVCISVAAGFGTLYMLHSVVNEFAKYHE